MFTLLTTIVSFLSGGVPKIIDFFQDKNDKAHELEVLKLQIQQQLETQKAGLVAQKDLEVIKSGEIATQSDLAQLLGAYTNDTESAKGASVWVINIRAMVRPAITFGLFGIFLFVEIFGCYYAIDTGVDFKVAINLLWNQDTQTVWASIIGFYFGCRHFGK